MAGRSGEAPNPAVPEAALLQLQEAFSAARHMKKDADSLHGVMQIVRHHLRSVQQELASAKLEVRRERQAAEIRVMEKECEMKFLRSEAEAYSLACAARTAAVEALQT